VSAPRNRGQTAVDKPVFVSYSSALYRGYIGLWELHDDELYFIGLADERNGPIDATRLFPGHPWPILARWFSGRLDLDRGERLAY
jgi:hypothetical protein